MFFSFQSILICIDFNVYFTGMRFSLIQIKIALILLLRDFNISINQRTKLPLKMETKGIILSPIGGLWFNFEAIKKLN